VASVARGRAGFTLIEILLAVAILAVVLVMVFSSFNQTSTLAQRVEGVSEEYQGARIALVKLTEELNSAYGFSAAGAAGFTGTDNLGPDGLDADALDFDTMARATPEGRPGSYHSHVYYRVEDDKLLHQEIPAEQEGEGAVAPPEWPLVEDLAGFRLRYLTKAGDWVDSWGGDDGQQGLPRAVEVTLFFPAEGAQADPDRDGYLSLKEVVRVPMGEG
jgi:general secretion pathway protein J